MAQLGRIHRDYFVIVTVAIQRQKLSSLCCIV